MITKFKLLLGVSINQTLMAHWRITVQSALLVVFVSFTMATTEECKSTETGEKRRLTNVWEKSWSRSVNPRFHQLEANRQLINLFDKWTGGGDVKGQKVLVPLCGKSLDLIFLRDKGLDVIGVELIQKAIDQFQDEQKLVMDRESVDDSFEIYRGERLAIWRGNFLEFQAAYEKYPAVAEEGGEKVSTIKERKPFEFCYDRASLVSTSICLICQYPIGRFCD